MRSARLNDLGQKLEELALLGAVERLQRLARDGRAVDQQLGDERWPSVVRLSNVRRASPGSGRESTRPRSFSRRTTPCIVALSMPTSRPRRFCESSVYSFSFTMLEYWVGVMLGSPMLIWKIELARW